MRKNTASQLDNLSLFDTVEQLPKIPVNYAKFDGEGELNWQEMFTGYNSLKVITFSSGDKFLRDVISLFDEVDIIFGWDQIVTNDINGLIAYQTILIKQLGGGLNGKNEFETRIADGSLRIYVAHECKSHEKMYILGSKTGKTRVITGSGNMSRSAFEGVQRENITIYDDDEMAYQYFTSRFEGMKALSTTQVDVRSYTKIDDIEKVPLLKKVVDTNCEVLVERQEDSDAVAFVRDVRAAAVKFRELGVDRCFSNEKGKTLILAQSVRKLVNLVKKAKAKEAKPEELPKLDIDLVQQTAKIGEMALDLNPTMEEIESDVRLFVRYFNGFDDFHPKGNETVEGAKGLFWKMLVWMFASPMIAQFHNAALDYQMSTQGFPLFLINYGDSSCGKTKAADTFLTAMVGAKIAKQYKVSGTQATFTYITGLRQSLHGVPIIFDDVPKEKVGAHLSPVIKNDMFLDDAKFRFSPPIVVSLNSRVQSLPQEICRRAISLKHAVALSPSEFATHDTIMKRIQSEMGTAFYREYLRRIIPALSEMLERMSSKDSDEAPDIFKVSSTTLCEIVNKYYHGDAPKCMRRIQHSDYFGDQAYAKRSIDRLISHWRSNPESITVNRAKNTLTVDFGESYLANQFYEELLPSMQMGYPARGIVVLNLTETELVSGIEFDRTVEYIRAEFTRNPKAIKWRRRQKRVDVVFSNPETAKTIAEEAVMELDAISHGSTISFSLAEFEKRVGKGTLEKQGNDMLARIANLFRS